MSARNPSNNLTKIISRHESKQTSGLSECSQQIKSLIAPVVLLHYDKMSLDKLTADYLIIYLITAILGVTFFTLSDPFSAAFSSLYNVLITIFVKRKRMVFRWSA